MSLSDTFRDVFRQDDWDFVVSAPGVFFICGEHACDVHGLVLGQPIPLFTHVAFRRKDAGRLTFTPFNFLDPSEKIPKPAARDPFFKKIQEDVTKLLNHRYYGFPPCDIGVFSEIYPQCGLGGSGALGVACAVGCYFLKDPDATSNLLLSLENENRKVSQLRQQYTSFDQVFRLAWKINAHYHSKKSSGCNSFFSLIGSPDGAPSLYNASPCEPGGDNFLEEYDKLPFLGFTYGEMCSKLSKVCRPIKHCNLKVRIYYTGQKFNPALRTLLRDREQYFQSLGKVFESFIPGRSIPSWKGTVLDALAATSAEVVDRFTNSLELPTADFNPFLEAINAYSAKLDTDLRISTPTIRALTHIAETQEDAGEIKAKIGAKISGPGGGGDIILFYVPRRGLEEDIEDRIKKHYIEGLSLHFEGSWKEDSFSGAFVKLDFFEKKPYKFLLGCDMLRSTQNPDKLRLFRIICEKFVKRGIRYLPTGPGDDSAYFCGGDSGNLIDFYFFLKNKCENEKIYLRAAIDKGETDLSNFKDYLELSGGRDIRDSLLPKLAKEFKLFPRDNAGICMRRVYYSLRYGPAIMEETEYVLVGKRIPPNGLEAEKVL